MQTHLESRPYERSTQRSINRLRDHIQTTLVYFDFFGLTAGVTMAVVLLISSLVQAAHLCPQKGAI